MDFDPVDEMADDNAQAEGMPAYSLLSGIGNSQCSGDPNKFCFFCAFQPDDDDTAFIGGADHPQGIRSLVRAMISQRKEIGVIVNKVQIAYDENVRSEVTWVKSGTNETVHAPEWPKDVIQRHLMHSKEFPDIFEDSIECVFHNIIVRQNEVLVDKHTGEPQRELLEDFLKTVRSLTQYKESRQRLTRTGNSTARPAGKNRR
jgi:hypothetical protein